MTKAPLMFRVPALTSSPSATSTGMDSPVRLDMSSDDAPDATTPSTGMREPGLMSSLSPGMTARTGISFTPPSGSMRSTCSGVSSMRPRMASEVLVRETASRYLPREIRAMSMPADS